MDVKGEVQSAIESLRQEDPKLWMALNLLNIQMSDITRILEPLVERSSLAQQAEATSADAPIVTFSFPGRTIRFTWIAVDGAALYEVRKGASWDTALFQFRTSNLGADVDPVATGTHTYLFKSINAAGNYSTDPYAVVVTVPPILAVVLTSEVIDNNVLLDWTEPASVFAIDHYDIYKDDIYLTFVRSSFFSRFEVVSGNYKYNVKAVDIAGNQSQDSEITVGINQPPDYVLRDQNVSNFSGTLNHMLLEAQVERIVGPVNLTETWADHFVNHSWTTIQNQIDAGYPIYAQPSDLSGTPDGYYEEVIDYGTLISSAVVTVTWNFNQFDTSDLVNIVVKMATSTDGITYTSFTSGAAQFLINIRYLKYRLELTAPSSKALIEIFTLTVSLAVKRENDGGTVAALSSDVNGTVVNFNKVFKDIDSITATVKTTTEQFITVIRFTDAPNPTQFSVFVYDSGGIRTSKTVEWQARGIV